MVLSPATSAVGQVSPALGATSGQGLTSRGDSLPRLIPLWPATLIPLQARPS